MGLSRYKLDASIAVSNMVRAKEFYEGKLGLSAVRIRRTAARSMRPEALREPSCGFCRLARGDEFGVARRS